MKPVFVTLPLALFLSTISVGCSLWPSKKRYYQSESPVAKAYENHVVNIADRYFKQKLTDKGVIRSELESADEEFYTLLESGATGEAKAKVLRNRVVLDLLTIADAIYVDFRNQLVHGRARSDTIFDVAGLALTGSATALADKGTKTALAAAATFLGGSKSAADANFFANQTTISLVIAMDGLRAETRSQIEQRLTSSAADFPISQAISMAQEYYQEGTIVAALISVNRSSAEESKKHERALSDTRTQAANAEAAKTQPAPAAQAQPAQVPKT